MKNSKLIILFVLCMFIFTSCNTNDVPTKCLHEESSWVLDKVATCENEGLKLQICDTCKTILQEEVINKLDHDIVHHEGKEATCIEVGYEAYDTCNRCDYTTYKEVIGKHNYLNYVCTTCYESSADNLKYELTEDESGCIVVGLNNRHSTIMKIVIPNEYCGKTVVGISNSVFENCTSLTSITIPDSVTTIGNYTFSGCTSLTSITIPDSVTEIGYAAFSYCTSLTSITIPDSVTTIGNSAFYNCTSLTSITIPDSVTEIIWSAFSYCTSLTSVTIPNSVTTIEREAFYGCTSLTSITIPDSVTKIGVYAFYGCTSLTSITIPDSVTKIGNYAFSGCASINKMTLPFIGESADNNQFLGYIFGASRFSDNASCVPNSLTEVVITGGNEIGYYAFYGCSSLTSITIPDSVTTIGRAAFYGCTSLTSITIPDSVTEIGDIAFYGCTSLTSVTIPNSVTTIGDIAFYGCTSLTSVTIPNSVTTIGREAFSGCSSLTIYCEVSNQPSGWSEYWNRSNCPVQWGVKDN